MPDLTPLANLTVAEELTLIVPLGLLLLTLLWAGWLVLRRQRTD